VDKRRNIVLIENHLNVGSFFKKLEEDGGLDAI
jgi:hypothetical protein